MPSQEFNSIDNNQLKMDLEGAAITLKDCRETILINQ